MKNMYLIEFEPHPPRWGGIIKRLFPGADAPGYQQAPLRGEEKLGTMTLYWARSSQATKLKTHEYYGR
jgi:hypothetical protein